ncbi:NAD(P)-binding domain-containing protein [Novosphingobium sp. KN65.2]|uniref:NAD(P)-binding domain-containing protein n=1 Tax=Novosphingobium sp. KN65.2 TaxID=1478134 RepID=UPI0005E11DDF|nr:NAD(P)-binding domain-containing protein [Novosphingobium sp. KN65.2]CDO36492.1 hypothetical protein SPHV1_2350064 [Novosphingobium sp. KN65.2]
MERRNGARYQKAVNTLPFSQIGIVGTGKVARAFALGLQNHSSAPLMVWGRTPAKCREAVGHVAYARAVSSLSDIVNACDVVAIAVADDVIPEIVRAITEAGALSQAPARLPRQRRMRDSGA